MSIMLGNLTNDVLYKNEDLDKFEKYLKDNNIQRIDDTQLASKTKNSYHIYDIPKMILCSDEETYDKIMYYAMNVKMPDIRIGLAYI